MLYDISFSLAVLRMVGVAPFGRGGNYQTGADIRTYLIDGTNIILQKRAGDFEAGVCGEVADVFIIRIRFSEEVARRFYLFSPRRIVFKKALQFIFIPVEVIDNRLRFLNGSPDKQAATAAAALEATERFVICRKGFVLLFIKVIEELLFLLNEFDAVVFPQVADNAQIGDFSV